MKAQAGEQCLIECKSLKKPIIVTFEVEGVWYPEVKDLVGKDDL